MTERVNTRELVLEMLSLINEKNEYSHLVIRTVLEKYQYLSKQDRAFITRLTEGTIERQIELDYIVDKFSKTKVRKMKPFIRNLIRMSVYQIKYMDSVPDSAVCNEAVKIAKRHKFGQLSGFVNGVLRNIVRNVDSIEYPDRDTNPNMYLSIIYSMPIWIVERFVKEYGIDCAEKIFIEFQKENTISIRTNLSKTTPEKLKERLVSEGVKVEVVDGLKYAFVISGFDYIGGLESFQDGLFYIQDVSSMMVAETAKPSKGDYVIDVCAAPGGKSTHMAEMLEGTGMVEARDLTDNKVWLIEDNIVRHELSNMKAVQMDATVFDEESVEKADILICDLPCSGLGVIGRKTDIRYKMTEESVTSLAKLQREILKTVHTYVKKGGVLVYSTCTIDRAENEDNVQWFLENYPEFELVSEKQMLPGETGNDGFFIAKFDRKFN